MLWGFESWVFSSVLEGCIHRQQGQTPVILSLITLAVRMFVRGEEWHIQSDITVAEVQITHHGNCVWVIAAGSQCLRILRCSAAVSLAPSHEPCDDPSAATFCYLLWNLLDEVWSEVT